MQIVILAGGLGTRLKPLTDDIPKPMVMIKGKPFIDYLVTFLKNQGFCNFLFLTGYKGDIVKDYFKDGSKIGIYAHYSHESAPLGTGGAIKNAKNLLKDEFILLNGDTFLPIEYLNLFEYFMSNHRKGVMALTKSGNGNVRLGSKNEVTAYDKKNNAMDYIDCGAQVFRKNIVELIPENKFVSLENDIFPMLIQKNDFLGFETNEPYYDIGTFEGIKKFESVIGKYF